MRYAFCFGAVLSILGLGGVAGAQTTHPSDAKVLVLPFIPLNPSENQGWLGRSIQQSLLADLTVSAPGRLMTADTEVPDMAAAAEFGRKSGASYVVHGSFTTLPTSAGEGLRIMGEVVDAATARPVASFKATGLYSEIFRLEDQVASQIRLRMPGILPSPLPPAAVPNVPAAEPAPPPLPEVNEYYQTYASPQAYVPAQSYYNYYYANPYYGYGYGYPGYLGIGWYSGLFFGSYYAHGSNFGGFDHDHFGAHDHDHGQSGGHGGVHGSGGTHVNSGVYNGGGAHGGHH